MKLSILIVNWNSRDYLRECLLSIRATCIGLDPQIVVVDGGSYDGSAEMIDREFPEVDFVQSRQNIGFGRSNNLGFTKVTGEALLLLNPDTELQPGAVRLLLNGLAELPDAGIIGARLLNPDGTLQLSSIHPLPNPLNAAFDLDWLRRRWWKNHAERFAEPFEVEAVSGACMMMHSKTFGRLAGFDPRYFMYAEDMDLCHRVHQSGMKIYHSPAARVIHHGGASSGRTFSKFSAVMIREALRTYLVAHHGTAQGLAYQVLMGMSAAARLPFLMGALALANEDRRVARRVAIDRWRAVLRWSLGLEQWAKTHFLSPPDDVAPVGSGSSRDLSEEADEGAPGLAGKSNLRVAIATSTCPRDRSAWSGTKYRMYAALCREFESVIPLGPLPERRLLAVGHMIDRISRKLLNRGFNFRHTPFTAALLGKGIGRRLKRIDCDVIFAPAGSAEISTLRTDIPIVYLSDSSFGQMRRYYENYSRFSERGNRLGERVERDAIERATTLVYPSQWAAEYVIRNYGASGRRIHVIPFGANIDSAPERTAVLPKKTGGPWQILFLGLSWKRKGGGIALETFKRLLRDGMNVELTVCGCTPPSSHPGMKVIPFLDKSDVRQRETFVDLMKNSHLLLLPTRADAYGIVFCEASAYGIPSIVTATGGTTAVVESGVNGYALAEDAGPDAYARVIRDLLSDPQRYQALCQSSRDRYETVLNWTSWGREMRKVLETTAGRRTVPAGDFRDPAAADGAGSGIGRAVSNGREGALTHETNLL